MGKERLTRITNFKMRKRSENILGQLLISLNLCQPVLAILVSACRVCELKYLMHKSSFYCYSNITLCPAKTNQSIISYIFYGRKIRNRASRWNCSKYRNCSHNWGTQNLMHQIFLFNEMIAETIFRRWRLSWGNSLFGCKTNPISWNLKTWRKSGRTFFECLHCNPDF